MSSARTRPTAPSTSRRFVHRHRRAPRPGRAGGGTPTGAGVGGDVGIGRAGVMALGKKGAAR
ncbi:hypothetical protein DRW03_33355 [Corallococcus sp. H22C18031201]|nr:hypothetical protein DRW03_33355 [Corallococcus sp. H22C18031201]